MTVVKRKLEVGCVRGVLGFSLRGWWDESLGEVAWGLVASVAKGREVFLLKVVEYNVLQSGKL